MAFPDTDDQNTPAAKPARPSWESAPTRLAATPRPAAPPRQPAALPSRSSAPAAPSSSEAPQPSLLEPTPSYAPAPSFSAASPSSFAPSTDPSVRYDLAGNPIPGSGTSAVSSPGPLAYSAGPAPGVWPPAPASPNGAGYQYAENGTDRVSRLKWNWGAFLNPFWWSIFNGQRSLAWIIFLINGAGRAIPAPYDWGLTIASVGIMFYLGIMGHRLAWSSERFGGDYDNFIRVQRAWMIWGFVVFGLMAGLILAAGALIPGFNGSFSGVHPTHTYGSGYGNGSSSSGSGQ